MTPTQEDYKEAHAVFTAMDAVQMGADDFGHVLTLVDADFAASLLEVLERNLALKNPPEIRVFTEEKILKKSVG